MDEDQVNEEQGSNEPERQEVTFSGASESISSVRKQDPVNLYTFFGKQNADTNERITVLESNLGSLRRQITKNQVERQSSEIANLTRINSSILTLQQGLKIISDKLEVSDQLRKIRDANEKRREEQLAQQQLREGKESLVEKKMQTALAAPLQKIGAKAQSVLGGIVKFFNTILLGIIGTRGLQVLGALITGNKEKLEEIKGKILKELGIASGIFLAINGGLAIALRSVVRLTGFIGRVAFTNLLARPIRRIFDLVSKGAFVKGATSGGPGIIPPGAPGKSKGKVKTQRFGGRLFGSALPRFSSRFLGGLRGFEEFQSGGDAKDVTAGVIGGFGTPAVISRLSFLPPYVRVGLILADQFGILPATDTVVDSIRGFLKPEEMDQIQSNVQNRQLELRERATNVSVVGDNTEETNVVGSGEVADASSLMIVASGNSDNPYLINSYIQYNVVV
jgi:hypothetical protein